MPAASAERACTSLMASCRTPICLWFQGYEVIGTVIAIGEAVDRFQLGDRAGVPWLGCACAICQYCFTAREKSV